MSDMQERASDFLSNIDTSMYSEAELLTQEHVVESILFMMGDSVPVQDIAIALECEHDIALAAAERLVLRYESDYKDRGMKVIRIDHKYQMVANNMYFKNLVLIASKPQKPTLTDAVLETLSIVAYKQPITKPEIENIRGVKSDFAVNRLIEYGLVEEKGRLDAPGRPIILGTTEEFLRRFGLESTDDLPMLPALRVEEIREEVEKELSESFGEPVRVGEDGKLDEGDNNIKEEESKGDDENIDYADNTEELVDNNVDIEESEVREKKEYNDKYKYDGKKDKKKDNDSDKEENFLDNSGQDDYDEPDEKEGVTHEREDRQEDTKSDSDDKEPQ